MSDLELQTTLDLICDSLINTLISEADNPSHTHLRSVREMQTHIEKSHKCHVMFCTLHDIYGMYIYCTLHDIYGPPNPNTDLCRDTFNANC